MTTLKEIEKFEKDLKQIKVTIDMSLGGKYRINPNVTVGSAVQDIWDELDDALKRSVEDPANEGIAVTRTAFSELGLYRTTILKMLVYDYLPKKYLPR